MLEQELLNSQRRYKTLTESSPVGIFHTDAAGYTTYVNPRWCEITGLSPEEGLGNGWLKAVHENDRDIIYDTVGRSGKESGCFYGRVSFHYGQMVKLPGFWVRPCRK